MYVEISLFFLHLIKLNDLNDCKHTLSICLALKVGSFAPLRATTDPSSVGCIPLFLISLHSAEKPSGGPVADGV